MPMVRVSNGGTHTTSDIVTQTKHTNSLGTFTFENIKECIVAFEVYNDVYGWHAYWIPGRSSGGGYATLVGQNKVNLTSWPSIADGAYIHVVGF